MWNFDLRPVFYFAYLGALVTWVCAPSAAAVVMYWLLQPRFGWTAPSAVIFGVTAALMIALGIVLWLGDEIVHRIQSALSERRHTEFMRLRARFYASNEVCLDSLETLRAKAAAADTQQGAQ